MPDETLTDDATVIIRVDGAEDTVIFPVPNAARVAVALRTLAYQIEQSLDSRQLMRNQTCGPEGIADDEDVFPEDSRTAV